jgi:hypothetical protein
VAKISLAGVLTSKDSRVFSGRRRGEFARKKFKLARLDKLDEVVEVLIPSDIYSVNSAFFLACFGESIRTLGEEKFKKKYLFLCPDFLRKGISGYINLALR